MLVPPKSVSALGAKLHAEFIGREGAVLPSIKRLLSLPHNQSLVGEVAKQWGIRAPNVNRSLQSMVDVLPTGVPHQGQAWVFLLRTAQCVALGDYRLEANLSLLKDVQKDPRVHAAETMHALGKQAISILNGERAPDPAEGKQEAKVEELGFSNYFDFVTAMDNFTDHVDQLGQPDGWLYANRHDSFRVAYRAITAAAVIEQELHIKLVPFDKPFDHTVIIEP